MIEQSLFDFDNPKDTIQDIEKVDLWTTYHAKADYGDISISFKEPAFPHKANVKYKKLTPPYVMNLKNPYAFMSMSNSEYIDRFLDGLSKMDAKEIFGELQELARDSQPCIVCFEKYNKMCHRFIIADWLEKELGIVVKERNLPIGWTLDTKIYLYREI